MKNRLYTVFFLLLFAAFWAQKEGNFMEKSLEYQIPFTTTQFSTKNGLSKNQIVDLQTNKDGLLFLSAGNGIYTFNGYDLEELDIDTEYRQHFFRRLAWNETYKKLFGWNNDGKLFQLLPEFKMIFQGKQSFHCFATSSDTTLSGTTSGDVYEIQIPELHLKKLNINFGASIYSLAKHGSIIYAGTEQGLYAYHTLSEKKEKLSDDLFVRLKLNPYSGVLYGVTHSKVFTIGSEMQEVLSVASIENKEICQDIEFTNSTTFYVVGGKGLYYSSGNKTGVFTSDDALSSNALNCIIFNKEENCLFIGTEDKGLTRLQFKSFFTLYKNQGLSESSLASVIKTRAGKIIFAEHCCKLHELREDTIVDYHPNIRAYYSVLAEVDDFLLCGTWGNGLDIFSNSVFVKNLKAPALTDNVPQSVYKDKKGTIWIGGMKGIAKGPSLETIRPCFSNSITSRINTIYELKNGDICLGGQEGFFIVNNTHVITRIGKEDGLTSKAVRGFYEDKEGKLWIGTYGGGVYCYEKNKLTSINLKKGCLLFEDAFCVAPDAHGNLYMTSNFGLWSVAEKALDDFYKDKTDFLVPAHYTEESGLLNSEFNGGFQNNFLKTDDDQFYFPTIEGLATFRATPLLFKKLSPVIESVMVNDNTMETNATVFPRGTSLLKFKMSCVNFSQRNNVYFQYKLIGDRFSEWSRPQKENILIFHLLDPGSYKLTVRAIDASNDKRPSEVAFDFSIDYYFYETIWFKILVTTIFLVLVLLISRFRMRQHKKEAEEKEFYARTIAEIELKAVQAQLNPHFIFNCLNTIKYFILDQDFEKANKGLNHFSKLLRDVLDNADRFTTTLKEKLKFITDYLELEKMRLGEQLQFTIINTVENTEVFLPAMLIQPHVENAIKHGIANLESKTGILTISFAQVNSFIECRITDNGIGREASAKIGKFASHTSFGTKLTLAKSEILKKIHNIEITTVITDLYSEDGAAVGTEVLIKIPVV